MEEWLIVNLCGGNDNDVGNKSRWEVVLSVWSTDHAGGSSSTFSRKAAVSLGSTCSVFPWAECRLVSLAEYLFSSSKQYQCRLVRQAVIADVIANVDL